MIEYDYRNPEHSLILTQIWQKLYESGELEEFADQSVSLHQFLLKHNPPKRTFIDVDEQGPFILISFSEWFNAAWMGLWIREDKRHAPSSAKTLFTLMTAALQIKPVLMAVTRKPDIVAMLKKLGYDISVVIPSLYSDGSPGWVATLHKARFKHQQELEPKQEVVNHE